MTKSRLSRYRRAPVQHVVLPVVEVDRVPVSHEPVLVLADEQVGVASVEEPTRNPLAVAEAGTDLIEQLALTVLVAEDILMRPGVPIGDGFTPRCSTNQFQ